MDLNDDIYTSGFRDGLIVAAMISESLAKDGFAPLTRTREEAFYAAACEIARICRTKSNSLMRKYAERNKK